VDFLTNPFIVILLGLYNIFASNLGLAIIAFTVLVRIVIFPLTRASLETSKRTQMVAPEMKEIRELYKGDREKMAQAQMELYRKYGINPAAGCLPVVAQMPILFGLYGAIQAALSQTPLQLVDLYHRLMVPDMAQITPLHTRFLWLNLGLPDPIFILPILMVVTTWLQMRLTMPPVTDSSDPMASSMKMMTTIFPVMMGFFSLNFASGMSLYWVLGNVLGILQYSLLGRIDWRTMRGKVVTPAPTTTTSNHAAKAAKPAVAANVSSAKHKELAPASANNSGAKNTPAPRDPSKKRKLSESKSGAARKSKLNNQQ
jgi:YidC/Oxa1 family membrane protein insertase